MFCVYTRCSRPFLAKRLRKKWQGVGEKALSLHSISRACNPQGRPDVESSASHQCQWPYQVKEGFGMVAEVLNVKHSVKSRQVGEDRPPSEDAKLVGRSQERAYSAGSFNSMPNDSSMLNSPD